MYFTYLQKIPTHIKFRFEKDTLQRNRLLFTDMSLNTRLMNWKDSAEYTSNRPVEERNGRKLDIVIYYDFLLLNMIR